jgi:tRNA(His) 5'-end guanylyltransferase
MRADDLESRMRLGECFHALRAPPGAFIVVRVDGRSFSRLTERLLEKPFDQRFHAWMVDAAKGLLASLHARYAYTESDEISVLLARDAPLFDREVEKLVSVSAARAAATVSLACGEAVEFDGRIWVGAREEDVVDYFRWRQADATRCAINSWCYWTLRREGKTAREATRLLEGASVARKNELLHSHGINFNDLPAWQRRGTGVLWEQYEKEGYDPRNMRRVVAQRRRATVNERLPMKDAYATYVRRLLG